MPGHATDSQLGFQWFGICVGICPEAVNLHMIVNVVNASSSSVKQPTRTTTNIIHHTSYIIHHTSSSSSSSSSPLYTLPLPPPSFNLRFPHRNHRPCRWPGAGFPPSSFPSGHPAAGHHEMAASHGWHLIGLDRMGLVRVLR